MMPFWCGSWDGAGGLWWIFPLLCLVAFGAFLFVCFRVFGCAGFRGRSSRGDLDALQREVRGLKEDVSKLLRPS
jgi:hypothetical protein